MYMYYSRGKHKRVYMCVYIYIYTHICSAASRVGGAADVAAPTRRVGGPLLLAI